MATDIVAEYMDNQDKSYMDGGSKKDEDSCEDKCHDHEPKRRKRGKSQDTDARRESHKIIEQKRRQKINDKINELRELLNYPDGSQNKAVVLQAAVENIRYLKLACTKMIQHHRQLQEEHVQLLQENERLRKVMEQSGVKMIDPGPPVSAVDQNTEVLGTNSPTLKSMTQELFKGVDLLSLYPEEAHAQALSMLSPLPPRMPLQTIPMIPNMSTIPQMSATGLPPVSFVDGSTRESVVSNSTQLPSGTTTNGQSMTSTETENGVSITRLIFPGA